MQKENISRTIILILSITACVLAGFEFNKMHKLDKLYPNNSLTKEGKLSDYFEDLSGTSNDSRIYFFEGEEDGATVLLLGGTHPNEPAAFIAATTVLENINVQKGRVIIIPQTCQSGFTCTDPFEAYPQSYKINTKTGVREFRFGSRIANPLDHWPDPLVYTHHPSMQQLSGFECRNLNRSYPGNPNGTYMEKVAYAIIELIKVEKIDIAFDLHEAAPEIPIINAIIYHEKCEDIALNAVLNLEFDELNYAPELSPKNFHGLSHREWGDYTDVYPFLMETSNPIQGRLRGRTNSDLVTNGVSPEYKKAQESEALRIEYSPNGEPLKRRVGRHVQGFKAIVESYNEYHENNSVVFNNIPSYEDLMTNGVGAYLYDENM